MGLLKKKSETKKEVPVNKRQVPRHIRISAAQTPPKNESDNKDKKKAILASMIFINFGLLGSLTFFALRKLTNLWREIVNWVKKHVKKVISKIEGYKYLIAGKIGEMVQKLREYWKEDKQWYMKETTTPIEESEVPPEILENYKKKKAAEYDATNELNEQLELCA